MAGTRLCRNLLFHSNYGIIPFFWKFRSMIIEKKNSSWYSIVIYVHNHLLVRMLSHGIEPNKVRATNKSTTHLMVVDSKTVSRMR